MKARNIENQIAKKSRDEIAAAYKSPPWWYDLRGFFILTFSYNSTLWHQISFFSRNIGKTHLEIACGSGTLLDLILKWRTLSGAHRKEGVSEIIALDYAKSMLAGAIRRFRKNKNITLLHEDAANLPMEDARFDTANIINSFHSIPDIKGTLEEAHRVLKDRGTLAINILMYPDTTTLFGRLASRINEWGKRKGILVTPYTVDEVKNLLSHTGFTILHLEKSGNCLDVLARKIA